jgi:hypothetical protein
MKLELFAASFLIVTGLASSSPAQTTERISVDSSGNEDHGSNTASAMSADGRYVAFISFAADLVTGDPDVSADIFLRDRQLGTTIRIGGVTPVSFTTIECRSPSVSADGRYVAYTKTVESMGVSTFQVFLYDRVAATTTTPSGSQQSLSGSSGVVLSGNGRYLAWNRFTGSLYQVYVHDVVTNTTTQQSLSSSGQLANSSCFATAISFDGRFVVFRSGATNLVPGDTNGAADIFVRDVVTGTTERVSVDSSGEQSNGTSGVAAISSDGRYVVFDSVATNLVPGDINGSSDVFLHDRATGVTTRISVGMQGEEPNGLSENATISADGRFVAYDSLAEDLVTGDTNGAYDVFVFDRVTGTTTRASIDSAGLQGNDWSFAPVISSDGARIAFQSYATNLVAGDTNNWNDIFMRDLAPGCPLAAEYCTAVANSTGSAASIASTGWASLSANNLVLATSGLPASTHGLFFFGTTPIDPGVPFGNGVRCVGGPLVRLGVVAAQNGVVSQAQDLTTAPYSSVQPGSTRHFEFWYRDPAAGGANFNASNALTLTFVN